jgi:hypothetical protein
VVVTVQTAHPTPDIAMAAGIMEKAIYTVTNLAATRETEEYDKYTNAGYYAVKIIAGETYASGVAFESQIVQ